MATLEALKSKKPRAVVWVTRRYNGDENSEEVLIVALDALQGTPAIAIVEFHDGIEHFAPENIHIASPNPVQLVLL